MTNLAKGGTLPQQTAALARVLDCTIDDGTDRQAWLLARQGRITATMAKDLVRGGAGARRKIIEESFVPPVPIVGNRYIDRGVEREPVIAAWVKARYGILPNARLIGSVENMRHASTPDGIGELVYRKNDDSFQFRGQASDVVTRVELQLAEIKTSKHDLDPALPYFAGTGYFEQMQWQMYTCNAARTLFVWEQHDDDWEHGPFPIGLEPRAVWIERDDAVIQRMIAAADLALAERDRIVAEQAAGGTGEAPVDEEILGLALAVLAAREEAKTAEARLKTPWTRMQTLLADRPEFSVKTGLAQVTWTNRVDVAVLPDPDAARDAAVKGLDDVTGADLLAELAMCQRLVEESAETVALAAAEIAWSNHLAAHTKRTEKSVQKLTVTAPKPAKETNR